MPALQPVVLTDRATTPVNYTLVPTGEAPQKNGGHVTGRVAVADTSGNLLSEKVLLVGSRRTAGRLRSQVRLTIPVVVTETINGVATPRTVRTAYVNMDVSFALDSTEQERNDAIGMFASALQTSKTLVHDTVVKGQNIW